MPTDESAIAASDESPPPRADLPSASGENVDGVMLEGLIRSGEITKTRAYQLAIDLCEAVQAVHDQHLIHGALSSRTVLVTGDWQVKLTGTGGANAGPAGGARSAAPARDTDDDIGALGAVIHEMFTGSPPESNGRVSRNLPPTFARVLMRCLQTDLARRYQSPDEVRAALVAALRIEKKRAAPAAAKPANEGATLLQQVSPPTAKPQTAAAPSMGPMVAPGRPPQRPVVDFIRWLDRLFWTCLSGFLHLSIIIATLILLVALFVMKDRITIETVQSEPEVETAAAPSPSPPPQIQQPLGLGPLPPPPILTAPRVSGAPIALPQPVQDPVAVLDAQYLNAVQWEITTALEASRLSEMPYLRSELQRLQNGLPMPAQDAPDLPARLKQLRDAYRREREKLTAPVR